ncbi:cytochrome c [Komagataeibacter intermedius]|nr:cytochrome c [Komagataeibacter intermedius]MCF3637975.1 cytochrome c [Komagataeibacter intermedius]
MAGSMMAALACMAVVLMAGAYGPPATAATQEGTLAVTAAGQANARTYTRAALLAMPQQRTVTLAVDPEHIGPQVEAVPLAAMTGSGATPDVLRLGAVDGFVAELPMDTVTTAAGYGVQPWIAIENPTRPWHSAQGEDLGPFVLVWVGANAGRIGQEQWVDRLVSIQGETSAIARWPGLGLPATLPRSDPAWQGQTLFLSDCMPCHRLNGNGTADKGPDLGLPVNAVRYLTPAGFHALVRNPRALRHWPAARMEGFPPAALSDADIDAIHAYLARLDKGTPLQ